MFNFLEKLREKSDRTKKQIAFCGSLLIAGIIFVVWLTSVYPDFRRNQDQEQKVASLEPSPFSTFANQISSSISNITSKFSEIKTSISSFSTDPSHYSATTSVLNGTTTNQ